uniref:Uncharacterized protein n=1 Tax=Meloidogyne enterolobii TaxID=390850 RepID=A0A6V7V0G4_MELEN|nr:unnamed protein product [Meloidogyne enterolobii]
MTYKLVLTNYILSLFLPHNNADMSTTFGVAHYFFCLTPDPADMSIPFGFPTILSLLSDPRQCRYAHCLLIFCRATPDLPSSFWFCRTPPPPRH